MASVQVPETALNLSPFRNEPVTDFGQAGNAQAMRAAIDKVRSELGREYPLVIGGREVFTREKFSSLNPAQPSQVVGVFQKAAAQEIEPGVQAASQAYESWSRTPVEERVELVLKVAALIRQHRHEFSAWMVFEVGKNWAEADADTAEALDFCEFYARQALRLSRVEAPLQLPGEQDLLRYVPLGAGVVIPPWNFPGAIMVGMTMAAVVAGNTVILKPSSDSPAICRFFLPCCGKRACRMG